jgi:hypothetical protein
MQDSMFLRVKVLVFCCVMVNWTYPNVSKQHSTFVFKGWWVFEDEGTAFLQNIEVCQVPCAQCDMLDNQNLAYLFVY